MDKAEWNYLTLCKKNNLSSGSFKNVINKMCLEILYFLFTYKPDFALNDQ